MSHPAILDRYLDDFAKAPCGTQMTVSVHCHRQILPVVALAIGFAAGSDCGNAAIRAVHDSGSRRARSLRRDPGPRESATSPTVVSITIAFAVLPATRGAALPDPIVPLYGGPGEQVIGEAGYVARQFAALRGRRDILLVDQRGTGRSSALRCRCSIRPRPRSTCSISCPRWPSRHCANELGSPCRPDPVHLPSLCARTSNAVRKSARVFAVQPERRVLRHPRRASLHACVPERAFVRSSCSNAPSRSDFVTPLTMAKGLPGSCSRRLSRPVRTIPPAGMHIRK